jgi:enoyl-CoA hydratase
VTEAGAADILIRTENYLGHITLNRPRQLNALTFDMVHAVLDALEQWLDDPQVKVVLIDGAGDRGLCAGGDIKLLHAGITGRAVDPAVFWIDEYRMIRRLATYPKPVVAVMSGLTMGGGVGVSGHCRIRVVTESSRIGMPETAIGLSPDVGGLHLLSRAPGEVGTHAALTGARFGPADAITAGLADLYLPSEHLTGMVDRLRRGELPERGERPAQGELDAQRGWIDDCYAGDDAEHITAALAAHPDPAARTAAVTIQAMSPTAVKVALRAVRNAASMTLDQVLEQDLTVGRHFLRHPDLPEGIRAQVIDKDRQPRWQPPRLDQVTDAQVATFFTPLPGGPAWQ